MFSDMDVTSMAGMYLIPWAINLALAITVFVIGRLLVRFIATGLDRFLLKSGMDEILVNFIISISRTLLLCLSLLLRHLIS